MKLSIYKNSRTDHTYQVNRKGDRYMIVERDWRFCGEQQEVGFVD